MSSILHKSDLVIAIHQVVAAMVQACGLVKGRLKTEVDCVSSITGDLKQSVPPGLESLARDVREMKELLLASDRAAVARRDHLVRSWGRIVQN